MLLTNEQLEQFPLNVRKAIRLVEKGVPQAKVAQQLGLRSQGCVSEWVRLVERKLGVRLPRAIASTGVHPATCVCKACVRHREIDDAVRCSRCQLRGHTRATCDLPTSAQYYADQRRDDPR